GTAFYTSRHGRVQSAYERLMGLMERRGSLTLFLLSAILNVLLSRGAGGGSPPLRHQKILYHLLRRQND
ncbi:hypothetical protein ACFLWN_04790, partial [Chloroflexota bacterium]